MTEAAQPSGTEQARQTDYLYLASRLAAPVFLLLLMFVFALAHPNFLTETNLLNVLRQVSFAGIVAVGMTFVILTAGIDLSVGALLAFCGIVAALVSKGGLQDRFAVGASVEVANPWFLALLAALVIGVVCGAAQGLTISRLRVPPFVVTLGGFFVFRGLTLLISDSGPISGFDADFNWWGQGKVDLVIVSNVPVPAIIFIATAIVAGLVLRYSRFGQHVYATGGNPVAAKLNGISTARVIFSVYVIVGFMCGLAAFLLAARLSSAQAVAGLGLELEVIAAVVIGGTSLFGGVGGISGTIVGVLLIGVLRNGLVLLKVDTEVQLIIIGLILVAAVAFDQYARSRNQLAT